MDISKLEKISRDVLTEVKDKIIDDLQAAYDTEGMNSIDDSSPLIHLESAKCAVEEHLMQLLDREAIKPALGVDCVIWCGGEPKVDRLTIEEHYEDYWEDSLILFGEEDKFLVLPA